MIDSFDRDNPAFRRRCEEIVLTERLIRMLPTDTIAAMNREIARQFPHVMDDDPHGFYPLNSE